MAIKISNVAVFFFWSRKRQRKKAMHLFQAVLHFASNGTYSTILMHPFQATTKQTPESISYGKQVK